MLRNAEPARGRDSGGATPRRAEAALAVVAAKLRHWRLWALVFFSLQASVPAAFAQASKEYQLKAVFLWRLAQFTHWPEDAFVSARSPVVICVLGQDPFGESLNAAVRGETAHGRGLIVQRHRTTDDIAACHILYIGASARKVLREIFAALEGASVLTVSDDDPGGVPGTMVRFVTEQNRIRLRINLAASRDAGLVFDPRLLRAAEVTGN